MKNSSTAFNDGDRLNGRVMRVTETHIIYEYEEVYCNGSELGETTYKDSIPYIKNGSELNVTEDWQCNVHLYSGPEEGLYGEWVLKSSTLKSDADVECKSDDEWDKKFMADVVRSKKITLSETEIVMEYIEEYQCYFDDRQIYFNEYFSGTISKKDCNSWTRELYGLTAEHNITPDGDVLTRSVVVKYDGMECSNEYSSTRNLNELVGSCSDRETGFSAYELCMKPLMDKFCTASPYESDICTDYKIDNEFIGY